MTEAIRTATVGDRVRITRHMIGRMVAGGPWHDESVEGKDGIITLIDVRKWDRRVAYIRMIDTGYVFGLDEFDRNHWGFETVAKGNGTVTPGVDYPFTEDELRKQRFDTFVARVRAVDQRHQGYSNAATFLAVLYLRNHSGFMRHILPDLQRKDGTVNPDRLRSMFYSLKLTIDAWAQACPIELPPEFARYNIPGMPRVNWDEVAADFKRED